MKVPAHLTQEAAALLDAPAHERIAFIQTDQWVHYDVAETLLRRMGMLVSHQRIIRMPNLVVVSRSGNGKTALLKEFMRQQPSEVRTDMTIRSPVLSMSMPGTPSVSTMWSALLFAACIDHNIRWSPALKLRNVKLVLVDYETRVLVIDEMNNLSRAGREAGDILAELKMLSNDLNLSIIAAGTQEVINAMNADPQMRSRFDPIALPPWSLSRDYLRFLKTYEALLPLPEPSELASAPMARMLFSMGQETIGNTVRILKKAAELAIRERRGRIDLPVLEAIEWTPPNAWGSIAAQV